MPRAVEEGCAVTVKICFGKVKDVRLEAPYPLRGGEAGRGIGNVRGNGGRKGEERSEG